MNQRSIVLASAVASVLLGTGVALATSNQHAIGGQACVGQSLTNAFGANNTTTSDLFFVCPMVVDRLAGSNTEITARVWDRHRTKAVACTFWGKDIFGNIISTTNASSSGTSATAISLSTSMPANLYEIAVGCTVPAADAGGPSGGISGISSLVTTGT